MTTTINEFENLEAIKAANPQLGYIRTIPEFFETETIKELTTAERRRIIEQSLILINNVYVHLPLKRAMYAIDPVRSLELLQHQVDNISEWQFHYSMIKIFKGLHDRHTNYFLPAPYNQYTVFLPFMMEEFYDTNGERHYIVSKLTKGFKHKTFVPGVEVIEWNGVQIEQAVDINADLEDGSNPTARHVRGLDRMTVRPMKMSLLPAERWIIVGYLSNGQNHEIRLPWLVMPNPIDEFCDPTSVSNKFATTIGLDLNMELTNQARKALFSWNVAAIRTNDSYAKKECQDTLEFRTVNTAQGEIGYLRIWSFMKPEEPEVFIGEVIRILKLLPKQGLIIDVRANGGGLVKSGERLLQLFSPHRVETEGFYFINNEVTLAIANSNELEWFNAKPWARSIALSTTTGAVYSQSLPLESSFVTNNIGRHYYGSVVLITDARSYSTTDIFVAGFQDNKLGKILGVNDNTGAGGASVFTHDTLREILPGPDSPFQELPGGTNMRVALCATTRVGDNVGLPLEDLGVQPDEIHRMTRDDVLHKNRDLIAAAAALMDL